MSRRRAVLGIRLVLPQLLHPRGVDLAGRDRVDRDAVAGPSSRDSAFAQPTTPGRIAFESIRWGIGSRTDQEVMLTIRPRPLSREVGQRQPGQPHGRVQRQLERLAPRPRRVVVEGAGGRAAGVVDQDVEPAARDRPCAFTSALHARPGRGRRRHWRRLPARTTRPPRPAAPGRGPPWSRRSPRRPVPGRWRGPCPDDAPQTIAAVPFSPRSIAAVYDSRRHALRPSRFVHRRRGSRAPRTFMRLPPRGDDAGCGRRRDRHPDGRRRVVQVRRPVRPGGHPQRLGAAASLQPAAAASTSPSTCRWSTTATRPRCPATTSETLQPDRGLPGAGARGRGDAAVPGRRPLDGAGRAARRRGRARPAGARPPRRPRRRLGVVLRRPLLPRHGVQARRGGGAGRSARLGAGRDAGHAVRRGGRRRARASSDSTRSLGRAGAARARRGTASGCARGSATGRRSCRSTSTSSTRRSRRRPARRRWAGRPAARRWPTCGR